MVGRSSAAAVIRLPSGAVAVAVMRLGARQWLAPWADPPGTVIGADGAGNNGTLSGDQAAGCGDNTTERSDALCDVYYEYCRGFPDHLYPRLIRNPSVTGPWPARYWRCRGELGAGPLR